MAKQPCPECNGTGKKGWIWKSDCQRCNATGYIQTPSQPTKTTSTAVKGTLSQVDTLRVGGRPLDAKRMLDSLCQPLESKLSAFAASQVSGTAAFSPDALYTATLRESLNVGALYALLGVDLHQAGSQRSDKTLLTEATQAAQTAIKIANDLAGDLGDEVNSARIMGYFTLTGDALLRDRKTDAAQYARQCLKFSTTNTMALDAQRRARALLQQL